MSQAGDLALILKAKIPIVSIESPDERRVLVLLEQLAKDRGVAFYTWSATRGLRRGLDATEYDAAQHREPESMLRHVAATEGPAFYALCDLQPYLASDPRLVRYLKDIAYHHPHLGNTVMLLNNTIEVPSELAPLTATFGLHLPSDDELRAMIRIEADAWVRQKPGRKARTDADVLDKLITSLRGATHADAEQLIRRSLFADAVIDDSDAPALNRLKFHLMDSDGALRYEHCAESFSGIAGLHVLRAWLELRRRAVLKTGSKARPKGMLLLGLKGTGKSLAARATAEMFSLPLVRLDFGVLSNNSAIRMEPNLRNSLRQAELMAPCVLWMDEIERVFAARESDGEASQRMLATLLTWMTENTKPVFLVATSNDISGLPQELICKGRLDEVFFVDLPDSETRAQLFRIHLQRRQLDAAQFDVVALAAATENFTGAEIEAAVVLAHYLCASRQSRPTVADLLATIRATQPAAVQSADEVARLREWAKDRTVAA